MAMEVAREDLALALLEDGAEGWKQAALTVAGALEDDGLRLRPRVVRQRRRLRASHWWSQKRMNWVRLFVLSQRTSTLAIDAAFGRRRDGDGPVKDHAEDFGMILFHEENMAVVSESQQNNAPQTLRLLF